MQCIILTEKENYASYLHQIRKVQNVLIDRPHVALANSFIADHEIPNPSGGSKYSNCVGRN